MNILKKKSRTDKVESPFSFCCGQQVTPTNHTFAEQVSTQPFEPLLSQFKVFFSRRLCISWHLEAGKGPTYAVYAVPEGALGRAGEGPV